MTGIHRFLECSMPRIVSGVFLVLLLAGCSKPASQLTAPSSESSKLAPGLPPIEQANMPRIHVSTDTGWKQFQSEGSFSLDVIYDLELPEGQPVTFRWTGHPAGQTIGYRWAVDLETLDDERPRSNDQDITHWSTWSRSETSATIGPFEAGIEHFMYIAAFSNVGYVSLFPIRIRVVDPAAKPAG